MSPIRQVFFDTETTGLEVRDGHRMIQFAGVEVINEEPTGREINILLNPDREVDEEASKVNGMTWDMLRDKPRFRDKVAEIIAFIEGAELVAHNSSFDEGFLQAELDRLSYPRTVWEIVHKFTDTMSLARKILTSQGVRKYKLDNLLDHYGIDRTHRDIHDALLDAQLLVPVYQRLISGVDLSRPSLEEDVVRPPVAFLPAASTRDLGLIEVSAEEARSHEAYLASMAQAEKVEPVAWETRAASRPRP